MSTVEVHWPVTVVDQRGAGTITVDRGATGAKWSVSYYTNNARGYAYATVSSGAYAIMTNGVVCYSLSPSDGDTIY